MQWWVISFGDKGKQPKEQVKWLGKGSLPYRRCVLYSNDPFSRPFDLFLSFVPLSPNIATAEKSWMGFLCPGGVQDKGKQPKKQVKWLGKGSLPYRRCVLYSNDPFSVHLTCFLVLFPYPQYRDSRKILDGFSVPGGRSRKRVVTGKYPPRVPLFFIFYFLFLFFSFPIFS